ncbi:Kinesin-like protein KIN-14S [Vitis vinifera]|uniref:Kinesin-like protein KIN-14S n=1 Tax=Vitis vinifera TaxID=29760 RepID=A0A438C8Q8_VITVI|nr:Kinesin-like protein KIN-14S [Vitis vinifera]
MFVQISPSAADLGETLCSLNFASRVWGIESGPVRKQADLTEIFKDKQMAENLKHDEKETKKLQDNLQSLQLKLAAREHICRSVQEKETRAIAAACPKPPASSSLKQPLKTIAVKKPALGPSKPRMPLRRISNFLLPPSPIPPHKTMSSSSIHPASTDDKENMLRPTAAATNTKSFLQPRRTSIAVRLPPTSTAQVLQPKRRVSIAAFRPESKSRMTTPLNTQLKSRGAVGRQSFVRDPHRIRLISRIFAPLRRASGATVQATPTAMRSSSRFMGSSLQATPTSMRSSSKFMGSPSMEAGSLRSKYPAIIASAKETVSVEPTEDEGGMRNYRRSLVPS